MQGIQLKNVTFETIHFEGKGFGIGLMHGTYQSGWADGTEVLLKAGLTNVIDDARKGMPMAILQLAEWYESGTAFVEEQDHSSVTLLPVSPETGFCLLNSAADNPNPELLFKLGSILERGIGTEKDAGAAQRMYAKAAGLGHHLAQYNLAAMQLTGPDATDRASGLASLERLAEAGHPEAQLSMAACFFPDIGPDWIKPDLSQALKYIDQAGSKGAPETQFSMALRFYHGAQGVPQDAERAWRLCLASANQGYPPALQVTGVLLLKSDPPQAIEWFEKAALNGVVDAQINLALFYSNGEICELNLERAYFWSSIAAKHDLDGRKFADKLAVNLPPQILAAVNASVRHWEMVHSTKLG
jgi:TPR repeat protein